MRLSLKKARALLRAMRGRRVLVLGDVMLDEFLWGTVARISPEAPVPVVAVTRQTHHLGGAANVACNVRALGGEAVLVGIVGRDTAAQIVERRLQETGVEHALAVATDDRPTTLKTRIIAHHQQVVRADRERAEDASPDLEDALIARVRAALPSCDALVVSDYEKGVATERVLRTVLAAARRHGVPVLVDPKVRHFARYRGVSLVTPNQLEAELATGIAIRGREDVEAAGARILKMLRCDAALVTRGEHGMALFRRELPPLHLPTVAQEVFDVTGAGDTVISTVGLALAAGAALPDAAMLANHAAGVVVGKLGTATATPDEVSAAIQATSR
jgi:rfaE bifunctional protein kinase chain/domain